MILFLTWLNKRIMKYIFLLVLLLQIGASAAEVIIKHNNGIEEIYNNLFFQKRNSNEIKYRIGDLYDVNGVRGVVFTITDGGLHGKIVSFDKIVHLPWCKKTSMSGDIFVLIGTSDQDDGMKNMRTLEMYLQDNNSLTWDNFPAFKWCRTQGEGWYLPAINEVKELLKAHIGSDSPTKGIAKFRKLFKQITGDKLGGDMSNFMSSTEDSFNTYFQTFFSGEWSGYERTPVKDNNVSTVRAIYAF